MQDGKKTITLYIAQQPYKLSVAASQEELYRKAEQRINSYIRQLSEKSHVSDRMTQMGYALINFAIKETYLTDKQHYVDTKLKENLKNLQNVLQAVLKGMDEEA